jgi:hypothetical protein
LDPTEGGNVVAGTLFQEPDESGRTGGIVGTLAPSVVDDLPEEVSVYGAEGYRMPSSRILICEW